MNGIQSMAQKLAYNWVERGVGWEYCFKRFGSKYTDGATVQRKAGIKDLLGCELRQDQHNGLHKLRIRSQWRT